MGPAGRGIHLHPAPRPGAAVSGARTSQRRQRAQQRRDARAARAEQRVRERSVIRARSQSPTPRLLRLARPGERSAHQVSTAHLQAAYPAVAEDGLGARGVYIGRDMHGSSFVYDPWELYAAGVLSDANMLDLRPAGPRQERAGQDLDVAQPRVRPRRELIDPKGEYTPLVQALGGEVLHLRPGGETRLNPLTRLGSREMREGLLEAIARAMLDRPLTQAEALGLAAAWPPPTPTATTPTSASPTSPSSCANPARTSPASSRAPARRRRRTCASARSRCSGSPTARCAACSTSPPRRLNGCGTRRRSAWTSPRSGSGRPRRPRRRDRHGLRLRVP